MTTTKTKVMNGRDSVKVAVVQKSPKFLDRNASIDRAVAAILEAGAAGAELIAFPEVWLAGYPFWTEGWDTQVGQFVGARQIFHDAAILVPSADTHRLGAAARQANAHVVIGVNEIDPRPGCQTIYNTMLFFNRDGTLMGRHRKLMPTYTERMYWGHGDASDLLTFDTDIGRISGLVCGENLMSLVRSAIMGKGADFHVAIFPGSFKLTGPRLQEPTTTGDFWGYHAARAHALEAGAFVLLASGLQDPADIDPSFPFHNAMNIDWANGGSAVFSPLTTPLVGPVFDTQTILYADCPAVMIKATKAIVDSLGHYSRPDILRLQIRDGAGGWSTVPPMSREDFTQAADANEVSVDAVAEAAAAGGLPVS